MKDIKKLMITLVALLAVTTGAWADGIVCTASDLGKVLCTDGSIYENVSAATNAGKTAAAVIAYVDETNKNGLALALADESGTKDYKSAGPACSGKAAVTGGTWRLPSIKDWQYMFIGCGASGSYSDNPGAMSYSGLASKLTTAQGNALQTVEYWSSTESSPGSTAWIVKFDGSNASFNYKPEFFVYRVRACLAFDIAAPAVEVTSGPKVAWDKDKKTGTFTMPGGNVTLEPEYYPQAALTAAPTAINDVPATTDGAIVKAGTVANIGSSETAQGTVMYYVSPTALDDAALLALAADQWTADVPTAQKLTKGQAYVYYYVRGNDSDTDEENFSDGDILAANALTVTIAAEPTYAVTFAEGTDPKEWTADPNTGVKKGQTVTVTYTGSKKVLGVKAEKKAKAIVPVPITVTWNNNDITGSGKSFTKDGVTITAGDIDFDDKDFVFGGTFTTTLGNFTKIEITTNNWNASGTGWSGSGQSGTWTGKASSVPFSGGFLGENMGNTKFVFTIEPTN